MNTGSLCETRGQRIPRAVSRARHKADYTALIAKSDFWSFGVSLFFWVSGLCFSALGLVVSGFSFVGFVFVCLDLKVSVSRVRVSLGDLAADISRNSEVCQFAPGLHVV